MKKILLLFLSYGLVLNIVAGPVVSKAIDIVTDPSKLAHITCTECNASLQADTNQSVLHRSAAITTAVAVSLVAVCVYESYNKSSEVKRQDQIQDELHPESEETVIEGDWSEADISDAIAASLKNEEEEWENEFQDRCDRAFNRVGRVEDHTLYDNGYNQDNVVSVIVNEGFYNHNCHSDSDSFDNDSDEEMPPLETC